MSSRAHILLVIPSLGKRGTERQLVELARGLDNSRFSLHVVTLVDVTPSYADTLEALGISVTCLHCRGKADYLKAIGSLRSIIKERDIDLVHGFLNLGSFVASIAGWLCGIPVVGASIRDARDSQSSLKYYRAVTARLSDVFTSNSKAGFNNRYKTWRQNFKVIYNGIDLSRFTSGDQARLDARARLNIPDHHRVIVMVAALSDHKDYHTYVDTAARLNKERDDLTFLSLGNGPRTADIHAYADRHGSPVRFLGSRADIDHLWPAIDVSVMLTNNQLIEEGLPNAVMESLACGVPAIANKSGGTQEVIDHLENGYLLEPEEVNASAIAGIITGWLDDGDLYARLSDAAKHKVREAFGYDHYIHTHQTLYAELLGHQPSIADGQRPD